jgi:hypothetical protein
LQLAQIRASQEELDDEEVMIEQEIDEMPSDTESDNQ